MFCKEVKFYFIFVLSSYRPFEVDGELDDLFRHRLDSVVGQHRGEPLSEGALVFGIDGGLVVFQANPESGRAKAGTHSGWCLEAVAALSGRIFSRFVLETFQVKLKNALTSTTWADLKEVKK